MILFPRKKTPKWHWVIIYRAGGLPALNVLMQSRSDKDANDIAAAFVRANMHIVMNYVDPVVIKSYRFYWWAEFCLKHFHDDDTIYLLPGIIVK